MDVDDLHREHAHKRVSIGSGHCVDQPVDRADLGATSDPDGRDLRGEAACNLCYRASDCPRASNNIIHRSHVRQFDRVIDRVRG